MLKWKLQGTCKIQLWLRRRRRAGEEGEGQGEKNRGTQVILTLSVVDVDAILNLVFEPNGEEDYWTATEDNSRSPLLYISSWLWTKNASTKWTVSQSNIYNRDIFSVKIYTHRVYINIFASTCHLPLHTIEKWIMPLWLQHIICLCVTPKFLIFKDDDVDTANWWIWIAIE